MKITLYPKYLMRRPFVHGKSSFFEAGYEVLYPDYGRHSMTPWQHYVIDGKRKGYDNGNHPPADVFFPEGYVAEYPDAEKSGMDPWHHYVLIGKKENRDNGLHPDKKVFFAAGYLERNPDVAAHKINPWRHYVLYGKKEGRSSCSNCVKMYEGLGTDSNKENVLVVGHEASRTGAPIVTFNIIKSLNHLYNVFTICLGGGALLDDIKQNSCCTMVVDSVYRHSPRLIKKIFDLELKEYKFSSAIVNSAEAACFLRTSFDYDIPSLLLVHEFAYYISPIVYQQFFWADDVVFSSEFIKKSFPTQFGTLPYPSLPYSSTVIHQGDPEFISDAKSKPDTEEQTWKNLIKARSKKCQIIAGLGTRSYRKGLDLFLLTAGEILKKNDNVFFVWVGALEKWDRVPQWIVDREIDTYNLRNNFCFIPNLKGFNEIYESLDLVLLTSRLDPLPNVIIGAMRSAIPFVLFEGTSGIGDILKTNNLDECCLARYQDCYDLADKALALLKDKKLYSNVSSTLLAIYKNEFSFDKYMGKILKEIDKAKSNHAVMLKKAESIVNKKFLYLDTSSLSGAKSGIQRVLNCEIKPYPGFLPVADAENRTVKQFDLIDEQKNNYESLDGLSMPSDEVSAKVAIHIHAYYLDELSEIVRRLKLNQSCHGITYLVSTTEENFNSVSDIFTENKFKCVIRVSENKGRDYGPFLTLFNDLVGSFEIIGHIHTKKSTIGRQMAELWKDSILSSLIGCEEQNSSVNMLDRNLSYMEKHRDVGLLFPDDPYVCGWNLNRPSAEKLIRRLGLDIPNMTSEDQFIFPVGSMFLARYGAIKNFFELTNDDFPPEPVPYDGTVLHAIERVLPFVSKANNFRNVCVFNEQHSRIKYNN